ncbi:MAG TPA: sigma-54 dependent transcriptional regulator [Acidobacteriaceae bacterium]|nr:sigma-54 dependent transcriptional regulator [Acidobacteriaceae bacterium]
MTQVRFSDREAGGDLPPVEVFFGRTKEMEAIRRKLEMVAKTNVAVLIQGESGTGKELCGRLIHGTSESTGELVKVSCPAIPAGLIETELFGYEKGSFTGAHSTKRGRLEQAHNGTLLLDEVGSLDIGVQAKLLQVLQDGSFMRVGGHDLRNINTRIVSVANRDLRDQVANGTFRLDFLYRINAVTLQMPALRQRTEDIPQLVNFFTDYHARAFQVNPAPVSRNVVRLMQKYDWPGNIRQLDNMIRSYVLMGSEDSLVSELVDQEKPASRATAEVDLSEPISLKVVTKQATQELERQIILKVLKANNWNRQKTAKWLKISYRSLLYKLNEVGASGSGEFLGGHMRSKAHTPANGLAPGEPVNLIQ